MILSGVSLPVAEVATPPVPTAAIVVLGATGTVTGDAMLTTFGAAKVTSISCKNARVSVAACNFQFT